jgi:hypothetical protein
VVSVLKGFIINGEKEERSPEELEIYFAVSRSGNKELGIRE